MQITDQIQFLELLKKSNLLTSWELEQAIKDHQLHSLEDPFEACRRLYEAKLLTRYQAEQLLSGRARGLVIDHYRLLELIGFGGMGSLYLALDTRSNRQVALKVLNEEYRHAPDMLLRLKLEAIATGQLEHENIIRTFEYRDTGAICYVAMEYVHGINLLELLSLKGPIPWPQACDFIRQAAIALQASHDAKILHRDVKVENLLVTKQGVVKLLDFGLALLPDQSDAEFSLSMIFGHNCIGTPDYMPPEQSADANQITPRADQYSLGCALYVLLTARFPFDRKTPLEKILAHRYELPVSLHSLVPGIPQKLVRIVERMMEKDPERRFESMQQVARELAPLAKRRPLEFSVNEIVKKRIKLARKRHQIKQSGKSQPKLSSKSAGISGIVKGSKTSPDSSDTPILATETLPLQEGLTPPPARRLIQNSDSQFNIPESKKSTAILICCDGDRRLLLDKDRFVIGRDHSCDLTIPAGDVSAKHCELRREGQWWTITDLNSTNGVKVNGANVTQQMLWHGDEIVISFTHRFRILDPKQPDPTISRKKLSLMLGVTVTLLSLALGVLGWLYFFR